MLNLDQESGVGAAGETGEGGGRCTRIASSSVATSAPAPPSLHGPRRTHLAEPGRQFRGEQAEHEQDGHRRTAADALLQQYSPIVTSIRASR